MNPCWDVVAQRTEDLNPGKQSWDLDPKEPSG